MPRLRRHILLFVALSVATAGCSASHCGVDCQTCGLAGLSLAQTEVLSERPATIVELDQLPAPSRVEDVLGLVPEDAQPYYALSAHRCQCLAVFRSATANALVEESRLADGRVKAWDRGRLGAAEMQCRMLAYHAVRDRNIVAAKALRLFYRLAEAEAGRDLLRKSCKEIDRTIENYDELIARGMQIDFDGVALRRKRDDLMDRQAELDLSIEQLNEGLRLLLGAGPDDRTAIWPAADLEVTVAPVDVDGVVAEGLASHCDLGAMRLVAESVERSWLPVARGAMSQINPLLGSAPVRDGPLTKLFGVTTGRQEREARRRQICQLLRQKEQDVERQIRDAAAEVEARFRQIALAKQKCDSLSEKVDDLAARREADGVTAFDVSEARLQLYQAESELVGKVVAWKLAEVDLKEAQGVLPLECGVELPDACQCDGSR